MKTKCLRTLRFIQLYILKCEIKHTCLFWTFILSNRSENKKWTRLSVLEMCILDGSVSEKWVGKLFSKFKICFKFWLKPPKKKTIVLLETSQTLITHSDFGRKSSDSLSLLLSFLFSCKFVLSYFFFLIKLRVNMNETFVYLF